MRSHYGVHGFPGARVSVSSVPDRAWTLLFALAELKVSRFHLSLLSSRVWRSDIEVECFRGFYFLLQSAHDGVEGTEQVFPRIEQLTFAIVHFPFLSLRRCS